MGPIVQVDGLDWDGMIGILELRRWIVAVAAEGRVEFLSAGGQRSSRMLLF